MESEEHSGFKWEKSYAEGLGISSALQEDEKGSIENSIKKIIQESKRQLHPTDEIKFRLGIMRYIYICLDLSNSMINQEPYPSRLKVTLDILQTFLEKYFELNPLSQIGIICCRGKQAERLCGFTSSIKCKDHKLTLNLGNLNNLLKSLTPISETYCRGEFSLNGILNLAFRSFKGLPGHSSKEILILNSSLSTIDAGSLKQAINIFKTNSIRCSIISFVPEIFIFKKLCSSTYGKYTVALNKNHLEILISEHLHPPPNHKQLHAAFVKMAFPMGKSSMIPSFCICHHITSINTDDKEGQKSMGYYCPQCSARYCQTPTECRICGLLLLTAPQLVRASQHFMQLSPFSEITITKKKKCFGCGETMSAGQKAYACKTCSVEFCIDCDVLLHESLHVCPSCG